MTAEIVTAIGAAATTMVGGSLLLLVYRMRSSNDASHESNCRVLNSIDRRIEAMDTKLDLHGEKIAVHHARHRGRGDEGV